MDAVDYDPYLQLGFGYQCYFGTLQTFGWVFLLISILISPVYYFYFERHGLESVTHGWYNTAFFAGNMGFNKAVCVSDYVQLGLYREMGCEVGKMSALKFTGVIPQNTSYSSTNYNFGYCNDPTAVNNPSGFTYIPNLDVCSSQDYFNYEQLTTDFNTNCQGHKGCNISMTSYVQFSNPTIPTYCTTNPAKVYLQYFCLQSENQLDAKREAGLFVSCMSGFISIIFLCVVFYKLRMDKLEF